MKTIALNRGMVSVVDDADFPLVSLYGWHARISCGIWYAVSTSRPQVRMHRLILGFPDSLIDHRDRDGLNNRRSNLRLATNSQNMMNRIKRVAGTSKFKGVCRVLSGKWQARITINHRRTVIGRFQNERDAAWCYDFAALGLFGDFARTNFINETNLAATGSCESRIEKPNPKAPGGG
jgi:hypothetical protein